MFSKRLIEVMKFFKPLPSEISIRLQGFRALNRGVEIMKERRVARKDTDKQ